MAHHSASTRDSRGAARRLRPHHLADIMAAHRPVVKKGRRRVLLAGKLDALCAPGGGEVQMQAMARHLPEVGVDARMWRPWEQNLARAECLHLFGSLPEYLPLVQAARRHNVRVLLSTISWFDLANCWREPWPWPRRAAAAAKYIARRAIPRFPSWRRRLYESVDLLLPNSQAEARQLVELFGVDPQRVAVVRNGADIRFAAGEPQAFSRRVHARNFVLYPGRIEPRKNQLNFLRALRGAELPIVILGDAVPGHEAYLAACRREAGANVRFVDRLEHDNPLLASAYAACGCLVLASWFETPGLVALEAGMSGVPLVLPEAGCAEEYFGQHARYVRPDDLRGIREAVLAAQASPRCESLATLVREQYTWRAAAEATRQAYEQVLTIG